MPAFWSATCRSVSASSRSRRSKSSSDAYDRAEHSTAGIQGITTLTEDPGRKAAPTTDDKDWIDPTDDAIETAAREILHATGEIPAGVARAIDACVDRIAWIARPDQLEEPKLAFMLAHWQSLTAAHGGTPDRSAVDVVNLVPALGNLMMLEPERDGFDAIYRVYGTAVADRAARDWTGFRVSEMNRTTRTPAALLYRACYRAVLLRPAPLFSEHLSPPYLNVRSWRRLILPLSDRGRPCARFLVCNLPVGHRVLSDAEAEELERRIQRPIPQTYPRAG